MKKTKQILWLAIIIVVIATLTSCSKSPYAVGDKVSESDAYGIVWNDQFIDSLPQQFAAMEIEMDLDGAYVMEIIEEKKGKPNLNFSGQNYFGIVVVNHFGETGYLGITRPAMGMSDITVRIIWVLLLIFVLWLSFSKQRRWKLWARLSVFIVMIILCAIGGFYLSYTDTSYFVIIIIVTLFLMIFRNRLRKWFGMEDRHYLKNY